MQSPVGAPDRRTWVRVSLGVASRRSVTSARRGGRPLVKRMWTPVWDRKEVVVEMSGFSRTFGGESVVLRPSRATKLMVIPELALIVALSVWSVGLASGPGPAPVLVGPMAVWLAWLCWDAGRRVFGSVTFDACGVTVHLVRRRTVRWQDIEAIDLSRGCRFAVEMGWRRCAVWPVLRVVSRGRVRLPIPAGTSKYGRRPTQHVDLIALIVDLGERWSDRSLRVQTVEWAAS